MTKIHPRADWTSTTPSRRTALRLAAVDWVAVHWPGSAGNLTPSKTAAYLRGWWEYHTKTRGWTDIAYNEAVDQNGEVWLLRGDYADGSVANLGGRVYSILAILGAGDTPSDAMLATIAERATYHRDRIRKAGGAGKIVGHRDLKSTDCPGPKLFAWLKAGMPTKATPPVVVVTPTTAPLLLGVANCQSYDGVTTAAAWQARADLMKAEKRTMWAWTETTDPGRTAMLARLGKTWKVWTAKSKTVALAFDSAVWSYSKVVTWLAGTRFGHGGVSVLFTHKATGQKVRVVACHIRPKSVATTTQKKADVAQMVKLAAKDDPAVIAGDFALNAPPLPGWTRQTPNVDTMDAAGVQRVDGAYTRGKITRAKTGKVINPGKYSDHKWLTVDLTVGGGISTL